MWTRFAVVVVVAATAHASWYTDPEWSFSTILGNDIDLHCNDSIVRVQDGDKIIWKSPSGIQLMAGGKYGLQDAGLVRDMTLTVKNVQDEDKGIYLCWVYRNDKLHTKVNRGINIYEPRYPQIIDKYRHDIIVGGVAAAIMFGFLCITCIVYRCRYRTEEEIEQDKNRSKHRKYIHGSCMEAGELPAKKPLGVRNEGYQDSTDL